MSYYEDLGNRILARVARKKQHLAEIRRETTAIVARASSPEGRATRTTNTSAAQQWATAVNAAMVQCGGNRQRATAYVARKRPELRARLLKEANADNAPRAHRGQTPVARRQPGHRSAPRAMRGQTNAGGMTKADFTHRVESIMERDGLSKIEAALKLSKEMGLSQARDDSQGI